MDVRELSTPDDYTPTPTIRCRVLRIEPKLESWTIHIREVQWDAAGAASSEERESVVNDKHLNLTKQLWNAQGFNLVARYHDADLEVLYYENRADRKRLEAETSTTLPESLEVWICPHSEPTIAFKCQVPQTIAFSIRSDDQLAQQDIGHTEVQVSERRGSLTAKVYWLNGQPSAAAQQRWLPIIEQKVRDYLKTSISQAANVFLFDKSILEESVRQGTDVRDLIVAKVDLQARRAQLKAMDYAPMANEAA